MAFSHYILLCDLLAIDNVHGFVKRDVIQPPNPNIIEPFQRNVNRFRECLDQSLASAVAEVNEKQLQPVFNALGDQVNRFSKAFDALTSPQSTTPSK